MCIRDRWVCGPRVWPSVRAGPVTTAGTARAPPQPSPVSYTHLTFTYVSPYIACTSPTLALGLRVYPPNQTAALFVATTGVGQCPGDDANFRIYPIGAPFDS